MKRTRTVYELSTQDLHLVLDALKFMQRMVATTPVVQEPIIRVKTRLEEELERRAAIKERAKPKVDRVNPITPTIRETILSVRRLQPRATLRQITQTLNGPEVTGPEVKYWQVQRVLKEEREKGA